MIRPSLIGVARQPRARLAGQAALWAPTLAIGGLFQRAATAAVADPIIGTVLMLLGLLPVLPMLAAADA